MRELRVRVECEKEETSHESSHESEEISHESSHKNSHESSHESSYESEESSPASSQIVALSHARSKGRRHPFRMPAFSTKQVRRFEETTGSHNRGWLAGGGRGELL